LRSQRPRPEKSVFGETRGGVTASPACRRRSESAVAVAVAVAVAWPAALRHPERTGALSDPLVRPPVSARLAPSGSEPSAVHRLEMCTRRRDTLAQGDDSARLEFHCPMSLNRLTTVRTPPGLLMSVYSGRSPTYTRLGGAERPEFASSGPHAKRPRSSCPD
jgi:hypothetical protein